MKEQTTKKIEFEVRSSYSLYSVDLST